MKTQHSASSAAVGSQPSRKTLIRALGDFRREWQKTTGAADLVQVSAPIGLVIADIAERVGLTPLERRSVLGRELNTAVSTYLEGSVQVK